MNVFAQIITTYAGPPLPINGAQAITQVIEGLASVIPDGAGGFYVASVIQNKVYWVSAQGLISTVAGSGVASFGGDSGPATSAQLNAPYGMAVDSSGNLFIADTNNNRIRKVSAGMISTVAGTGTAGFSGDGGPATSARLSVPFGVALDNFGNLFIADTGNSRIRKVTPSGLISTVAGNGTPGFSGDGGSATSAQLGTPFTVVVDGSGNLFIAQSNDNRIRKVTFSGVISTLVGTGTAGFSGDGGPPTSAQINHPLGLAVDESSNLFIADRGNHRIRKVTSSGVISTVVGTGAAGFNGDGGPATSAQLNSPRGVTVDSSGNLFIADTGNDRTRKVTSGVVNTVAGRSVKGFSGDGGPATSAQLSSPYGLAVDSSGNLFMADTNNNRIRKITPAGVISTVAGSGTLGFSGDGGPATSAELSAPYGVAADSSGNLFIADTYNNRIRKVTPAGVISTVAGTGTAGFSGDGGTAGSAQLSVPYGVAVDSSCNLFIADTSNNRIRKVTPAGVISTVAGSGTSGFSGDGGPAISAQLAFPTGLALDGSGNLFIADTGNSRIRKLASSGLISTAAGSESQQLQVVYGVAVDGSGNLFIADRFAGRILKVTPAGVISTVAGTGTAGFSGDGGPATSAQITLPTGVAVDGFGNLFIGDDSGRIRRVSSLALTRIGTFAQIASGGGWKSTLTLVNLSAVNVMARVTFYSDAGIVTALPLVMPDGTAGTFSVADVTIGAKASATLQSEGATPSVNLGWADVQASGPLSGYLIFRQRTPGFPDSEGTAPLEKTSTSSVVFGYNNKSGFSSGIALANPNTEESMITATFWDQDGNQLGMEQFPLPGSGHASFMLNNRFAATADRTGTIEFQNSSGGGITGLGLRFSSSLSFTSLPILR